MNLLPTKIISTRTVSGQIKKLATVQIVIIGVFAMALLAITLTANFQQTQAQILGQQLQHDRFSHSEEMQQIVQDYQMQTHYEQSIASHLNLPVFNIDKLQMIQQTLPDGVILLNATVDDIGATLFLDTDNLALADVHRDAWVNTGLTSRVQMTSATLTEDSQIRYVLSVVWQNES
ncbi:MAG: hypothetical protein FWG64_14445 [Firmicutes bacterium]|nr:hypothetical protein [Bacillota bacterium]